MSFSMSVRFNSGRIRCREPALIWPADRVRVWESGVFPSAGIFCLGFRFLLQIAQICVFLFLSLSRIFNLFPFGLKHSPLSYARRSTLGVSKNISVSYLREFVFPAFSMLNFHWELRRISVPYLCYL